MEKLMSNYVLIAVIIIFAIFTYIGTRRGLVRTVFSLFSSIVVLLMGTVISPVISNELRNNEKIFNAVSERIERSLENYQKDDEKKRKNTTDSRAERNSKGTEKKTAGGKGKKGNSNNKERETRVKTNELYIPANLLGDNKAVEEIVSDILKNEHFTKAKEDIQKEVNHRVAVYLTGIVINSGTFIIVYLILGSGLFILGRVLNVISRLPVLNELNRLGGGIAGFFKGLVIIWLIFAVMIIFIDKPLIRESMKQIDDNVFLKLLYNYNIIAKVIGLK